MSQKLPHVIMILLDDLGFWTLGMHGNQEIQTPNIDRLAKQGVAFQNCYCVSPVCSPARASLLTGRIPSQHGVQDWIREGSIASANDRPVEYLAGMRGFSDVLNENGYYCGQIGKWHLGDSYTPQKGFSHWVVTPKGSDNYYGATLFRNGKEETIDRYLTDELTDEAISFLRLRTAAETPFFLSLNFTAPHRPWRQDQHPAEVWSLYDGCTFETCPKEAPNPYQINNGVYPEEDKNEMVRGYCTALTAADAAIGRVLDELDDLNITDETLVILTSDNGMSLGHHGIYGKGNATFPQNMYDQAVKVPFVMRHPARIPPQVSNALISHYDFCPTLFDYLELDQTCGDNLPGRTFLQHVLGDADPGRDSVVIFDEYGPVRMLRNARWKFIYRIGDWSNELYDMESDPQETVNLIDDPDHAQLAIELENELRLWFKSYVTPGRDASANPNFGRGQTRMVDEPGNPTPAFADDWFYQSTGKNDGGPNL